MSRLFLEDGESIPVTAISVCGNFVADIKTKENNGYNAVVLSKSKKLNNLSKSQSEFFKKNNINPGSLSEFKDATHGNSLAHRAHGSIGQCQTPGRVWKGKKMSGHMGNVQKTVQNLKIVELDVENNVVYVKGAVPGFNGSEIKIKPSYKKTKKSWK